MYRDLTDLAVDLGQAGHVVLRSESCVWVRGHMCRECPAIIAAFVTSTLARDSVIDVRQMARAPHPMLPHLAEDELLTQIDAAMIGNWVTLAWGATVRPDRTYDPQ